MLIRDLPVGHVGKIFYEDSLVFRFCETHAMFLTNTMKDDELSNVVWAVNDFWSDYVDLGEVEFKAISKAFTPGYDLVVNLR